MLTENLVYWSCRQILGQGKKLSPEEISAKIGEYNLCIMSTNLSGMWMKGVGGRPTPCYRLLNKMTLVCHNCTRYVDIRSSMAHGVFLSSTHTDAVTGTDLVRVGQRLLESNPAFAAIGDLTNLPSRRILERTLFSNHGKKTRRFFSFR